MNKFQIKIQLILNTLKDVEVKCSQENLNNMLASIKALQEMQTELADVLIPAEFNPVNPVVTEENQNGTDNAE